MKGFLLNPSQVKGGFVIAESKFITLGDVMRGVAILFALLTAGLVSAAGIRSWSSSDGKSKIEASYVSSDGRDVVLKTTAGKEISVPVSRLSSADRIYIAEQRRNPEPASTETTTIQLKEIKQNPPKNLPYKLGEIIGPIEADSDAHYLLYLPTTLREGRKAPLLFYTHSGGGNRNLLEPIIKGAELNGWVLAVSMESRNSYDVSRSMKSSKESVEHILDILPVDEDRLYFTGNSGGGAMAFYNYDNLDGYGLMPNVGYNPGVSTPRGDAFIINGGNDFNRYTSAAARKDIGKTAIHRLHRGGHGKAPAWLMTDGIVWLEGKHLARKGAREPAKREEYVLSILTWINELKGREPYRAYYWAKFLGEEIDLTPEESKSVKTLTTELSKDQNNQLYVDGLKAIDELSLDHLSKFGTGSKMRFNDSELASDCRKLLKRYAGVPIIDETLNAMMKETGAL